jgi:thiol-disulfide isomerase/thioredoxin
MGKGARKRNLIVGVIIILALIVASLAYTGLFTGNIQDDSELAGEILTFQTMGSEICTQDGKPVIRLFSTTWCSHCNWIKDTYDSVVKEYAEDGKIIAYHWELDANDDTLTPEFEAQIPESEMEIYRQFNPRGSIPTFVFGCKYYRVGNGYEQQGDLGLEEEEFRAVIENLIAAS